MVADGYAYHYAQYSGDCPNGDLTINVKATESQMHLVLSRKSGHHNPANKRLLH